MTSLLINPTAFEAGLATVFGDDPVHPARRAAFEAFQRSGLPHRRMEEWRWTDMRRALSNPIGFGDLGGSDSVRFQSLSPFVISVDAHGGHWNGDVPAGVKVENIEAPVLPERLNESPMALGVAAFTQKTLSITVEENAIVSQPILIAFTADASQAHARLSVTLGEGASAHIIEEYNGVGLSFLNALLSYDVKAHAALERTVFQEGDETAVLASLADVTLKEKAHYKQSGLFFGAKLARMESRLSYEGEEIEAEIASASLVGADRHIDATSHIVHHAEKCKTRQLHKSVVTGNGTGIFQGKFLVHRGAQETDAQMTANALLLHENATANHKPELEIYADDVECAHGSTCGALDTDALFYLRQRGLDEASARALLIDAFTGEVIDGISEEKLRDIFHSALTVWLEGAR